MFCYGFGHSIQDTLQIVQLTRILDLDDNNLIFTIESFDINPVELIILRLLVTLAFQNLHYMNLITYQHRKESFEHTKIGFMTQQTLDSPIKTDIFILQFHKNIIYSFSMDKDSKKDHSLKIILSK